MLSIAPAGLCSTLGLKSIVKQLQSVTFQRQEFIYLFFWLSMLGEPFCK